MHEVEFVPVEWLKRAAWAAQCGERLEVYSRPIQVERRWGERRVVERPGINHRMSDSVRPFQSLQLEELALV